jgi:endogenous inhibitor of DNA gyrase (YacG/DUF329 family)
MKQLDVECPTCKKIFSYFSSTFRPFCCEKCRLIDLGQWLTESYSVPVQKLTDEELITLEQLFHEKEEPTKNDHDENS